MQRLVRRAYLLLFLLLLAGTRAEAQGIIPIAVEGRGAFALPQGEWNDAEALSNGFGYGFDIRLQVMPLISIYGGWDTYSFDLEDIEDADANDSGVHLGGQLSLPLSGLTGVSPFAFAGLVFNQTEMAFENNAVSLEVESDRGVGYELGAGLGFPFAPALTITPQVRYRSHGADFPGVGEEEDEDVTVSYLSFEVGLKLGL
ncbi:MAG TPA: outer membrane beta-barrel protein [Longimicrobiaceae bacterium]